MFVCSKGLISTVKVVFDLSLFPPTSHNFHSAAVQPYPLQKRSSRSSVAGELYLRIGYDPELQLTRLSSPAAAALTSPDSSVSEDLPSGWTCQVDRNGRTTYVNDELRLVCTSREEAIQIATQNIEVSERTRRRMESALSRGDDDPMESQSEENLGPLPPGWVVGKTKSGK